jgi:hypothetical protein
VAHQCIHHRLRVLACHLHQHHVASLAFHQRRYLAVGAAKQQVSFPMAWYRSIFDVCRALARNGISNLAVHIGLLSVMA